MIAHTQTHTRGFESWDEANEGDAVPGNCVQTSIASLLELPLDAVPHFALFGNAWGSALHTWLNGRGKHLRVFTDRPDDRTYWQWFGTEVHPLADAPTEQLLIATGPSHNGPWQHVVLWRNNTLTHDPHPSRRGLAGTPTELWQITDIRGATA